jgi:signal transduction histidine kinase
MKIIPRSLQGRTAVVIALAFFFFLTLFFVTTYVSIHSSLLDRSDGEVRAELERIASETFPGISKDALTHLLSENRSIGESPLHDVFFESQGGNFFLSTGNVNNNIPPSVMTELKQHAGQPLTYASPEGDMRLISITHAGMIIAASYNTIVLEEAENSVIHVFTYYLAGGLIIGILGGIFLSKYLIGPISDLAASARNILRLHEASPARLPVSKSIEEVANLAQSINQLLDARELAMERQRNFAADAAHELRTPLTVLKGEIEVELRMIDHDSLQAELLHSNLEEIERLISTVQDLLELAEIEADHTLDSPDAECSIHSAIQYAADRLHGLAAKKGILLIFPENDVIIRAQEKRITRLIYNLLLNAVEHSGATPQVEVRLHLTGHGCILEIEDHGKGIPTEQLEHLFERFHRSESGAADKRGGAGLGLAIVKSIADHYGYELGVQSAKGSGTTVSLSIPQSAIFV